MAFNGAVMTKRAEKTQRLCFSPFSIRSMQVFEQSTWVEAVRNFALAVVCQCKGEFMSAEKRQREKARFLSDSVKRHEA